MSFEGKFCKLIGRNYAIFRSKELRNGFTNHPINANGFTEIPKGTVVLVTSNEKNPFVQIIFNDLIGYIWYPLLELIEYSYED